MDDRDTLYGKWLTGEISDEELKAAEGDEALSELQRVVDAVDQWSMPAFDEESAFEKFEQKHRKKATPVRKMNWLWLGGIAASLLIVAFVMNTIYSNSNQVITAAKGQNKKQLLKDGSEIWLNDGSAVSYSDKNWSKERSIELKGEALFQVSKGVPFIVNTSNGFIKVLGTQFNVRAWGENLRVECYEGKVQVTAGDQQTVLLANEAVNVAQAKMDDKQGITHQAPFWQSATSRFYNEKLVEVFREIERQFDVRIQAKDTGRIFSGNFRHDDLDNALRDVCKPLGIQYAIDADKKIITIE